MSESTKAPVWYWIVSVVALLWNGMGVINYIGQAYMTEEMIAALSEQQQQYYQNVPAWATAGFAIAVFAGLIGSILLLFKKSLAYHVFILSFLGVLLQNSYWMFLSGVELAGAQLILPITVILFGLSLIFFAKGAKAKGWMG